MPDVPIPVVRISRGEFDPDRFAEVEEMTRQTGSYLMPAIERLPGLISYHAAISPTGSMVHVSVWQSDDHANQMGALKEMIVDARAAAEAVGVEFGPIINYSLAWDVAPSDD